jgi:hypothetical protein
MDEKMDHRLNLNKCATPGNALKEKRILPAQELTHIQVISFNTSFSYFLDFGNPR